MAAEPDREVSGPSSERSMDRPFKSTLVEQSQGPTPASAAPGQPVTHGELSRYRVLGEIARGGMGAILKVYDAALERELAVKVLLDRHQDRPEFKRRFLDEARIHSQLQHPGVAPVHELGRFADGRPYFAMKLVEGRTLAAVLRDRNSPADDLPRLLTVFEQICQTLAYAHSRGIIHRDLKPPNIMVGAFGEVQVMDWGLARRLKDTADGSSKPDTSVDDAEPVPADCAQTLVAGAARNDTDRLTRAGSAIGTPAYMPPEQARGEIARLDERCDVFGLGAILCEILTGEPPYRGRDMASILNAAERGDLTDAFARLDSSRADAELVRLARSCLAADREQRPRDAGAVAAAVTAYLAGVRARLQAAEIDRATAQAKAGLERKRRRLAVGLAVAVILLVLGAGAVAIWYSSDQAKREVENRARRTYVESEITNALQQAERHRQELHRRLQDERLAAQLLSELDQWRGLLEAARAAWTRADRLAASDPDMVAPRLRERLASLGQALGDDERDRQLAFELDRLRVDATNAVDGKIQMAQAAPKIARAFADAGYVFKAESIAQTGAQIKQSPIRIALVGALDFWALTTEDETARSLILEAARRADPEPWRDRCRQPAGWDKLPTLQPLTQEVVVTNHSPQLLAAFALRLRVAGGDAATFLRHALAHHPRDFWLLFELAHYSTNPVEQAGAFRAALAARPSAAYVYYGLGVVLAADRKPEHAMVCYRRAIELEPHHAGSLINLGLLLSDQKRHDEAIQYYRQALKVDRVNVLAYINLGASLQAQEKLDEAIDAYRTAIEIDPKHCAALNNLGTALRAQLKLAEAAQCFRLVVKNDPHHAMAWCNLGHTLSQQGQFKEALQAMQRGHELGAKQTDWTYPTAQWIKDIENLIAADQRLSELLDGKPVAVGPQEKLTFAHLCQAHRKRFATAARFYLEAFNAEPTLADQFGPGYRYNAACAAALAAAGQGADGTTLTDAERTRWRQQALTWLRAELEQRKKFLNSGIAQLADPMASVLRHWKQDPDLATIRDASALANLPQTERQMWKQFWDDVNAQLAKTGKDK